MSRITTRERVLLLLAFVVVCLVGYAIVRLAPALKEIEIREAALEAAETRIARVEWPHVTGDADALRRELEETEGVIREAQRALLQMEGRFVSLTKPDQLEDLRLQMSARASACRIRFRENVLCPTAKVREHVEGRGSVREASTAAARLARFLALAEPYELPVREVAFDATFQGLRDLLAAFAELPGEVVILAFDIDVKEDAQRGPTQLATRLLLVY